MIHLIQVDRDGIMSFACDTVELFTEEGATRAVFKQLQATGAEKELCPYCVKALSGKRKL